MANPYFNVNVRPFRLRYQEKPHEVLELHENALKTESPKMERLGGAR